MKVVIITGMSGAGRSRAADWFEDQGYYCVDNMPPALIDSFLEMTSAGTGNIDKVVFVADLRSRSFFDQLSNTIDDLRARKGIQLTVLFMEADPKEIVRRYNEVRRNHPVSGAEASLAVIEQEGIKKSGLLVMKGNEIGNAFWRSQGWTERVDLNYYSYSNVPQVESDHPKGQ